MLADVVIGLQHGDEAKGKVTHHLCKSGEYTHVLRYNGGCNAGHTIYHEGRKFVTHHIPAGVFYGIKSIIGPGCVVHVDTFLEEIEQLEKEGIPARELVSIASNAHLITDFHKIEKKQEELRERLKVVEKWVIGAAAVLAAGVTLIGFATNISKAYL